MADSRKRKHKLAEELSSEETEHHESSERSRSKRKKDTKRNKREASPEEQRSSREAQDDKRGSGDVPKENVDKSSRDKKKKRKSAPKGSESPDPTPPAKGGGGVSELSIVETNKLRESLGLKPLEVGPSAPVEEESAGSEKKEDIHVPAKNIGEEKSTKQLREKMAVLKEKRKIAKKLSQIQPLSNTTEESATDWVLKMKQKDEEKKLAAERAKVLEEMDSEFGVDSILSDTLKRERIRDYRSSDLSGLTVEHDTEMFKEGRTTVLTLKDVGVLDESGDVLQNVNIVDTEKASRNIELRKKGKGYEGFEDEFDELGNLKEKKILSKYEEEIEGIKKATFTLSDGGSFDVLAEERERAAVRERLTLGVVSLSTAPAKLASEYYTEEEMVKFKKPKKRRLKKKTVLKADDLIGDGKTPSQDNESADHGKKRYYDNNDEEVSPMETDTKPTQGEDDSVEWALNRTRRLLNSRPDSSRLTGTAKVAEMVKQVKSEEPTTNQGSIVLDTTAEFCRKVGENKSLMESKKPAAKDDDDDDDDVMETSLKAEVEETAEKWQAVEPSSKTSPSAKDLYQEPEPVVASGTIAALKVATVKGFLDASDASKVSRRKPLSLIRSKEDSSRDRERRDMYGFPEKRDYQPTFEISYKDDYGRNLDQKEAFRFMSHKFHGKGSGVRKTEKRLKKLMEEVELKKVDSADTPLGTLGLLQEKQRRTNCAYVTLSGAQTSGGVSTLSKSK